MDLYFRASWIRIRILPSKSKAKNEEKPWFLLLCDFLMTFYFWKMLLTYLQKGIRLKTWRTKIIFCWHLEGHWRKEKDPEPYPHPDPFVKGTWFEDPFPHPDQYQNVTGPEHCFLFNVLFLTGGSICPRTHRISSSDPASPSQTTQQEPGNILYMTISC
jgi:hypothetical protein